TSLLLPTFPTMLLCFDLFLTADLIDLPALTSIRLPRPPRGQGYSKTPVPVVVCLRDSTVIPRLLCGMGVCVCLCVCVWDGCVFVFVFVFVCELSSFTVLIPKLGKAEEESCSTGAETQYPDPWQQHTHTHTQT